MITKLVRYGTRLAVILDPSIVDSLQLDERTSLELERDGERIILTPTDQHRSKCRSALCDD